MRGDIIKAGLILLALSIGFTKPLAAGQFENGWTAFKQGDYVTTLSLWRPLAEDGVSYAQYNIGLMYAKGLGVKKSNAIAAVWYRRAANQGDIRAQNNLGTLYAGGQGVAQNYAKAFFWFSLSSTNQKDSIAAKSRDNAAQHLTPAQIKEVQRMVLTWKPKAPTKAAWLTTAHQTVIAPNSQQKYLKGKPAPSSRSEQ